MLGFKELGFRVQDHVGSWSTNPGLESQTTWIHIKNPNKDSGFLNQGLVLRRVLCYGDLWSLRFGFKGSFNEGTIGFHYWLP